MQIPSNSDFSLANIPFGIAKIKNETFVATRIGDNIVNLHKLAVSGKVKISNTEVLSQNKLNPFISLGKSETTSVRQQIITLANGGGIGKDCLHHFEEVTMLLPVSIPNYTDFYSSIEHATNVGIMFRDPANALLPNWKHIPVGYHGRASSIVVSGTDIKRPHGQMLPVDADKPVFGKSKLLDFELEMGFIIGKETQLGDSVSADKAEDYIFGLALFNDWSARDIQKWEYVPLGPFLGKNFGSSLAPWIVTMEALEPFRVAGPQQDPAVLPYLETKGNHNFDIDLEVFVQTENGDQNKVSHSNFKYMYWSMAQQLAHHTVNGCNIEVGDLYASGTISGPTPDSYGSMLELAWKGTKPVKMKDGTERKFIQDGDTVVMKGYAQKDDLRVGFGEVSGKIVS